jgi:hypothetical protein
MQHAAHLRTTIAFRGLFGTLQGAAFVEIVGVNALDLIRCNNRNAHIEACLDTLVRQLKLFLWGLLKKGAL